MRKKITAVLLLMAMVMSMVCGCGKEKKKQEYILYYLNSDVTKVVPEEVKLKHHGGKSQIDELLTGLKKQPDDTSLRQTIPSDVKVLGVSLMSYQITVDFSREYYEMKPTEEILTRAAIVKTLQIGRAHV